MNISILLSIPFYLICGVRKAKLVLYDVMMSRASLSFGGVTQTLLWATSGWTEEHLCTSDRITI